MMLYFNRLPGLGKEDVEILLNELEEKGYINDQRYVLDRLDSMQFSLTGKGKIRRTLLNKGIDPEIIDQALNNFDDVQEACLLYTSWIVKSKLKKLAGKDYSQH